MNGWHVLLIAAGSFAAGAISGIVVLRAFQRRNFRRNAKDREREAYMRSRRPGTLSLGRNTRGVR